MDPKQLGLMAMTMAMTCEAINFCNLLLRPPRCGLAGRYRVPSGACSVAQPTKTAHEKSCGMRKVWFRRKLRAEHADVSISVAAVDEQASIVYARSRLHGACGPTLRLRTENNEVLVLVLV